MMASVATIPQFLRRYSLLLTGLLLLALPTLWSMVILLWDKSDQEHGPILLLMFGWTLHREWPRLQVLPDNGSRWGWLLVVLALLAYVMGRSQQIWLLEIGAFIPLLAGCGILAKGGAALRPLAFPLLMLLFAIPLPSALVDLLTTGLKQHVSVLAENLLYSAGYPIARSGVTLTIGSYQLLVADACSGLNSLFSLFAVGLLYLYMQGYQSRWRNLLLLLAIAPIAILANVVRVVVLVLLTYYGGDALGQGFLHGVAGILLFAIALLALYLLDAVLGILFRTRSPS
nr:exosortase B [uncultured Tolumonas sp.]